MGMSFLPPQIHFLNPKFPSKSSPISLYPLMTPCSGNSPLISKSVPIFRLWGSEPGWCHIWENVLWFLDLPLYVVVDIFFLPSQLCPLNPKFPGKLPSSCAPRPPNGVSYSIKCPMISKSVPIFRLWGSEHFRPPFHLYTGRSYVYSFTWTPFPKSKISEHLPSPHTSLPPDEVTFGKISFDS